MKSSRPLQARSRAGKRSREGRRHWTMYTPVRPRATCAIAIAGLVLGSIGCSSPGEATLPPGPVDTVSIAGHHLFLPKGFTANLFAEGVAGVRFLALGPGGVVYATQSNSGRIVKFVDTNGDGTAESSVTV